MPDDISEMIARDVYCVMPSIGWWRGIYGLPKAKVTVEVGQQAVDPGRLSGNSFRIMTKDWPTRYDGKSWWQHFSALEHEKMAIFEPYGAWHIRGVYVVPKTERATVMRSVYGLVAEDAAGVMRSIRDETRTDEEQSLSYRFNRSADEFAREYPRIIEDVRRQISTELADMILPKLPTAERIRSKFYLRVGMVGVANFTGIGDVDGDAYDKLCQQATAKQVEDAVRNLLLEPRQMLAAALHGIVQRMDEGGKITARSFGEVFDALERMERYAFLSNDEFRDRMSAFRRMIAPDGETPAVGDLNGESFRRAAAAMASEMENDAAAESSFHARFGQNRRMLTL